MSTRRSRLRLVFDIATSIVMILAASTVIYQNVFRTPDAAQAELQIPAEPLSIDGAHIRGSADATTVMIIYSDFQCPFCRRFAHDVMPEIERRYVTTGRVALAFRHLPLPIHEHAIRAAVMAECAGEQHRFWEMHDALFSQNLDEETLHAIPKSIVGFQKEGTLGFQNLSPLTCPLA